MFSRGAKAFMQERRSMAKNEQHLKDSPEFRMFFIIRKIFKRFLLLIIAAFFFWLQVRYDLLQVLWKTRLD